MRVAILADLSEPVGADAQSDAAVFTYELADALGQASVEMNSFAVDLVARRGSWRGLPLLSIDPEEVPLEDATPEHVRYRQEALYCQFILSGMLRDYDVIHCVAPLVTPVQTLVLSGKPVCQTFLVVNTHAVPQMLSRLLSGSRLWTSCTPLPCYERSGKRYIPPSVDFKCYTLARDSKRSYVLCPAADHNVDTNAARTIAGILGKPLRTELNPDPVAALRDAYVMLDLSMQPSPAGQLWAIRALASGVAVAAWETAGLGRLLENECAGAQVPPGNCELLARRIEALPQSANALAMRREIVLLSFSRRPVVASYVETYRTLLGFR